MVIISHTSEPLLSVSFSFGTLLLQVTVPFLQPASEGLKIYVNTMKRCCPLSG